MSTRGSRPVIGRAIKVSVEEPLLVTALVMAQPDDAPRGSYNALLGARLQGRSITTCPDCRGRGGHYFDPGLGTRT